MNVLVLGGTSIDEIVRLPKLPSGKPETLFAPSYTKLGSTGAGKAIALSKLGFRVTLHTLLGDDEAGKRMKEELSKEDLTLLFDASTHSERHINLVDGDGNRISIFTATVDSDPVLNSSRLKTVIESADLVVANIVPYVKTILPWIQAAKKPIWTDLHDYEDDNDYYEPFIEAAEVLFLSADRLKDFHRTAKRLLERGKKFVVVTLGKDGSVLFETDKPTTYEPILKQFPSIDPSGAGDSFFAGFLYGVSQGRLWKDAMIDATIAGGSAVATTSIVNEALSPALIESIRHADYE